MRRVTPAGRGGAAAGRMVGIPAAHDKTSTSLGGRGINWVSYLYKNGGESPKGLGGDRKHFFHEVSGVAASGSALPQVRLAAAALAHANTFCPRLQENLTFKVSS